MFRCLCAAALLFTLAVRGADVYDLDAIRTRPLDAKVLKTSEADGLVTEQIEFTSDTDPAGQPIRTPGLVVYPKGGTKLPGILWCQGGMADAGDYFPKILARKGGLGLSITLAKDTWKAFGPFDAAHPADANLVRLTVAHLRAVTYLAQRAEVDATRLGVGGSSYGGVYATLVAGIDPRIKVGMSFFSGGRHELGTNLPQFTALKTLADAAVFRDAADGATRLRERDVPFLWGVAANDHWFHLPAVVDTFATAKGDCRIAILPHWAHGFYPAIDQELIDFYDVHLFKNRKPFNKPGPLTLKVVDGKLIGSWSWSAENAVTEASLVVSYGRVRPWHGWLYRYHHPYPAMVDGHSAMVEIPVPEPEMELYAFGNIVDDHQVLISSLPVTATPAKLGLTKPTGRPTFNAYPLGEFEADDVAQMEGCAIMCGKADKDVKHGGAQSLRFDPPTKPTQAPPAARLKLLNVYERSHRLSLWLRADAATTVEVKVTGEKPAHWNSAVVQALLATQPDWKAPPADAKPPVFTVTAEVGPEWREVTLDCPFDGVPVEGYNLTAAAPKGATATWWLDSVRFVPQWR